MKTPAWKCMDCRRMIKGNDLYCPACGQYWEVCMDRNHQEIAAPAHGRPLTPTRHTTYRGNAQDSSNWDWQRRPSQSPRQRQRPRSRRQRGYGQDLQSQPVQQGKGRSQGKGRGKPHNVGGKAQQQHTQTQNAHRLGQEGMAPLPPPPLPPQMSFGETPWAQLAPPFPASGGHNPEPPAVPSAAEVKLKKVMGVFEEERDRIAPGSIRGRQGYEPHGRATTRYRMHDAVENLGDAQQAFEKACFARAQHLASWRQFLHLSVQRWQEYSQHFLTQERYNLDQIASARDAVKSAQSIFKDMQEKGIITIEADDDPAMEEEPSATKTESSRRIMEGLEHMTSSLENLANQADKEFATTEEESSQRSSWWRRCNSSSCTLFRCWIAIAAGHGAFGQGSQRMTELYPCGQPALSSCLTDLGVGWRHTIIEEPNFVSPWEASFLALDLSFQLGTLGPLAGLGCCHNSFATRSSRPGNSSAPSKRSVQFCDSVDLLLGLEDDLTMFSTPVTHDELYSNRAKS